MCFGSPTLPPRIWLCLFGPLRIRVALSRILTLKTLNRKLVYIQRTFAPNVLCSVFTSQKLNGPHRILLANNCIPALNLEKKAKLHSTFLLSRMRFPLLLASKNNISKGCIIANLSLKISYSLCFRIPSERSQTSTAQRRLTQMGGQRGRRGRHAVAPPGTSGPSRSHQCQTSVQAGHLPGHFSRLSQSVGRDRLQPHHHGSDSDSIQLKS